MARGAALLATASLCLWFLTLPAFALGIWVKAEPAAVALYGAGAIAAVWLSVVPRETFGAPLALLPLSIALPTFALSPLLAFPARSWFGAPQVGQGGFWWLSVAVLTALMASADRRWLTWGAVASGAGIVAWTLVAAHPEHDWSDWTAFAGFGLVMLDGWPALLTGAALVAVSGSKGAWLLAAGALVLWALWHRWRPLTALAAGLAFMVPFAATAAMFILPWPSAHSRAMLIEVIGLALPMKDGTAWHGAGWGEFNDAVLAARPTLAAIDPTWEGLGMGAAHSHNLWAESLLALGPLGMFLAVALFAVPPLISSVNPRALAAWVALAGLYAIWYPLPQCAPFLALGLAALGPRDA
jgi:hypothetical protein